MHDLVEEFERHLLGDFGFQVSGFWFWVPGFGFRVSGFGLRDVAG
jgi:hypothetical protein